MGVDLSRSTPSSSSNVLDRIQGEAGGLGQGLASGLTGIIGGIGQALLGIFTPGGLFSPVGEAMQQFRDGQEDLTDRTDLLSPLLDYGSAYVNPDNRVHGTGFAVFSEQLGPMRGCEIIAGSQGGIRLLDKGLWDIRVHLTADNFFSLTKVGRFRFELRVYSPSGEIYSRQIYQSTNINALSGTIVSSVVVDEPGYRVRVYVLAQESGRGILGGPAWSRLAVQHIARDVDGAWSKGNEDSNSESTS